LVTLCSGRLFGSSSFLLVSISIINFKSHQESYSLSVFVRHLNNRSNKKWHPKNLLMNSHLQVLEIYGTGKMIYSNNKFMRAGRSSCQALYAWPRQVFSVTNNGFLGWRVGVAWWWWQLINFTHKVWWHNFIKCVNEKRTPKKVFRSRTSFNSLKYHLF
jgi:hypothetical protein